MAELVPIVDGGLGNTTWVVDLGDGRGHGERATTAASVLERAGHRDVAVVMGGPDAWARSSGRAPTVAS